MAVETSTGPAGRHRPKTTTVFVAAFVAGAVAAVVVNRALDLHLAQSKPQVESEPIFVALRAMPQGAPVTVWDVALRDWPRAMLPTSALRAGDSFEGSVLKYPVREGQPLLSVQLAPAERPSEPAAAVIEEAFVPPPPAAAPTTIAKPETKTAPPATASSLATKPTPKSGPVTTAQASAPIPPASAAVEKPTPEATASTAPATTESAAVVPTVPESASVVGDTTTASTAAPSPEGATRKRFELEPTEVEPTDTAAVTKPEPESPTLAAPKEEPTRVASDVDPMLDVPSRPAADLEKIPSVMASSDKPAKPAEPAASSGPVRYLVVPERIARQADTSFVPPPAVEPTPEPSPAPTQPEPAKPTRSAKSTTPPVKGFPQRPGTSATASRPTTKQSAPRNQSQTQQPPKRSTQSQSQPSEQPQRQQQAQKTPDRTRTETASKPREPMFPVLAAGLEAMGNRWRGGDDEATASDQPTTQRRK